jgi:hypothetical protein
MDSTAGKRIGTCGGVLHGPRIVGTRMDTGAGEPTGPGRVQRFNNPAQWNTSSSGEPSFS